MDDLQRKHGLTDKQWAYVLNRTSGLDPTESVIDAYDFKPGTKRSTLQGTAYDLERHPRIRAAIVELSKQAVTDAVMSRREALERLTRIARASVADVMETGVDERTGRTRLRFKHPDAIDLECVSRMSDTHQGQNVQMHSPLVAIKQLAEMLGWEAPKRLETTAPEKGADEVPVDLGGLSEELLMELWTRAAEPDKTQH